MAFDKITGKNYLSKPGPHIPVYSGWYNSIVDILNYQLEEGFEMNDGVLTTSTGTMAHIPVAFNPSKYIQFFDDFLPDAGSAAPGTVWTVTEDDAANTQLIIDGAGGILRLTNKAGTDDNGHQVQAQKASFRLIAGKELWFETRIKIGTADVTNVDFYVGLAAAEDLTGVADNMPANGIVFTKTDAGVGTVFLASSDNGTNKISAASLSTMVTDTWIRLGFHFDGGATGAGILTPYVNGSPYTSIPNVTYATMAEISPIVGVRNGDAVTTTVVDVDYIHVIQER